jgi:hypothetical protein
MRGKFMQGLPDRVNTFGVTAGGHAKRSLGKCCFRALASAGEAAALFADADGLGAGRYRHHRRQRRRNDCSSAHGWAVRLPFLLPEKCLERFQAAGAPSPA